MSLLNFVQDNHPRNLQHNFSDTKSESCRQLSYCVRWLPPCQQGSFSLCFLPGYSWFCSIDGWAMLVFFPQSILTVPNIFLFCLSRSVLNSLNRKLFYECIGIMWNNSCIHIVSLGLLQTLFQGSFILGDS